MCLLKLSLVDTSPHQGLVKRTGNSYLLQAVALLEYGYLHSKSNFQISLLLVRLYSYLGCGSLAMRAHKRLALKQNQLNTLSYIFFDRVSTLHPHPFSHSPDGISQYRSPMEQLRKQYDYNKGTRDQINKNAWLAFKHSSYNSVLEIREVSDTLCRSMSAIMAVIESRKTSRLVDPSKAAMAIPSEFYDLCRLM